MNQAVENISIAVSVNKLLDKQRTAHLNNPYPSLEQRIDRIDRLVDMVLSNKEKLIDAVAADFGNRSPLITGITDLLPVVSAAKHAKKHLKNWMRTERRKSNFPLDLLGARSSVEHLPLGVVGSISPWNFPINLSLGPAVDIFAAGNRMMLKPSELSRETSAVISEIVSRAFDEKEFAVVQGGPDVAYAFASVKFDHLLFTGSPNIARSVAKVAATNLVPITLELGGKNPTIIAPSANLHLAAEKLMWAKTLNGGQVGLSPDLVYVHSSVLDEFVDQCKAATAKMYNDFKSDEAFTNIISDLHAKRLRELVEEAEDQGATVIKLGEEQGNCIPPSLVLNAKYSSKIMREEIFGGPLPLIRYDDLEDVARLINKGESPLALYYLGEDNKEIDYLSRHTLSGGMTVNDFFAHNKQDDLPFGGVGESGTGACHGHDGFKNFSHARAIYKQSKRDPIKFIRPPFTDKLRTFVDSQLTKQIAYIQLIPFGLACTSSL